MDTEKSSNSRQRLSAKLLKAVLLAACSLGIVLSLIQIFIDARQSSAAIDVESRQMLAMIREPVMRSAHRQESKEGKEVLTGLLEHKSVHVAAIKLPDAPELAVVERPLSTSRYRHLSDYIFNPIRIYRLPLQKKDSNNEFYGELLLAIDTAYYGREFIQRACIILLSGIVRALLMALMLYMIYTILLTRPLNRLIQSLSRINPDQPGKHKLPMPKGHSQNELGLWVRTANQMLASIDRHLNLRQKAEAQIMRLSQYDYLTRLPNRRTLQKQLQTLISHSFENSSSESGSSREQDNRSHSVSGTR